MTKRYVTAEDLAPGRCVPVIVPRDEDRVAFEQMLAMYDRHLKEMARNGMVLGQTLTTDLLEPPEDR